MKRLFLRSSQVFLVLLSLAALLLSPTWQQIARAVSLLPVSAIGDTVWVDEDGDGDVDAGEPGIPNVRLTLAGQDLDNNPVSLVTYTDTNGQYKFGRLIRSNTAGYNVSVDPSTLPAGLAANQTYDENGLGTPHTTRVVIDADLVEHVTADFGYNWASPGETNTPSGSSTGMIGDLVWIDADGNGRQDAGEPGLSNVSVQLVTAGADATFGSADDVIAATTNTNAAGNYAFDGLAVSGYRVRIPAVPAGYSQTGDPDQPGSTCTGCDGLTTSPVLLSPGDVFLNADFGFQPASGSAGNIGDTLWVDHDLDLTLDPGERRLARMTVALLRDQNGNGSWDAGEPIIATAISDVNGEYLFTGVPVSDGTGSDDYLVWVNDTLDILNRLTAVFDADGAAPASGVVTGLGISAVSDLAPGSNLDQDFAFALTDYQTGESLVGDTVWLDLNGNSQYDNGEGMEGVTVYLYDASFVLLETTQTNEHGQYYFSGLAAGNYEILLSLSSLPPDLGLFNFADPDGGSPHRAVFNLSAGEIDLSLDFGYNTLPGFGHAISGTVWEDADADGVLEAGESSRFPGVTLALYIDGDNNGVFNFMDGLVGTTTTDGNGDFNFGGLIDSRYFVDVTDEANVLNGTWHSLGTAGSDNNSQVDLYTIVLLDADNTTADFGYYSKPAALGDYVWLDRNNNGVQAADEPGIQGALVTLSASFPGGGSASYSLLTGSGGLYNFGNLLLDEDYSLADATPATPTFTLGFTPPPGTTASPTGAGTPATDSNGTSSTVSLLVEGTQDITYDSGFYTLRLDLGDLPVIYPTTFNPGPAAIIFPDTDGDGLPDAAGGRPAVWLGLTQDVEPDGQPSPAANLDGADEDSLRFNTSGWLPGQTSSVTITLNSDVSNVTVYFGMWIDWGDGSGGGPDGTFDVFYSGSGVTNSPEDVSVQVTVPGYYVANTNVYFRVRAADAPLGAGDYQGTLINGEVEDYLAIFSPTVVDLVEMKGRAGGPVGAVAVLLLLLAAGFGIGAAVPVIKRK